MIWLATMAPALPPEFPWWLVAVAVALSLALAFVSGLLLGVHLGERRGLLLGERLQQLREVPARAAPRKGESQWWRSQS